MKLILVKEEVKMFNDLMDSLSIKVNPEWTKRNEEDDLIVDIPYEDTKLVIDAVKDDIIPVIGVFSKWYKNKTFETILTMILLMTRIGKPEIKDDIETIKSSVANMGSNYVRSIFSNIRDDITKRKSKEETVKDDTSEWIDRIRNEVEEDIIKFNIPKTKEGINARLEEIRHIIYDLIVSDSEHARLILERNALDAALTEMCK